MKKTITSVALMMSAVNAHALVGPNPGNRPLPPPPVERTFCVYHYESSDGSMNASDCDSTARNEMSGVDLLENGCAKGQIAIKSTTLRMRSCPSAAQL